MSVVTTFDFKGQTEAALEHYKDALGAEVLFLMRFRDSPDQTHTKTGMDDLIFHATFRVMDTVFMASDVGYEPEGDSPVFAGFALALQLKSLDKANEIFRALANEGQVLIPLAEASFTSWYGIVVDRFGIAWKINVETEGSR